MKLHQLGLMLTLTWGGMIGLTQGAWSITLERYSFSRQYEYIPPDEFGIPQSQQASFLAGEFAGRDLNGDGFITGKELGLFKGVVTVLDADGNKTTRIIDSDIQPININEFNFSTLSIASTLDQGLNFSIGNSINMFWSDSWLVNFSDGNDYFSIGTLAIPGQDSLQTGTINYEGQIEGQLLSSIPEPGNVMALGLLALGLIGSRKKFF